MPSARVKITSHDKARFKRNVKRHMERGMTRAVIFLEGVAIRKVSRGQPVKRSGKTLRGLDPSKPGEPPKVLHSDLRRSIDHEVSSSENEVAGRYGTNDEKARRLELGFVGTDKRGRSINQAARPFLRPSLLENREEVLRRFLKG